MAGTITLHNGTQTSSGSGSDIAPPGTEIVGIFIHVTAVSGTLPTLIVSLQDSPNGTDWYSTPGYAINTPMIATGLYSSRSIGQKIGSDARLVWTIGGVNPSFTFVAELVCV